MLKRPKDMNESHEKYFAEAEAAYKKGILVSVQTHDNEKLYAIIYQITPGIRHRGDGPARRSWHENGTLASETYYKDGKFHRRSGPAVVFWNEAGVKVKEEHFIEDIYHRKALDGPAYQEWDREGKQTEKVYIQNGKELHDLRIDGPYGKKDGGLGRVFR